LNALKLWAKGAVGVDPPEWVATLMLAHEWATPPWQIEAECSQQWYERWAAYNNAVNEAKHGG
jgi:hypothetical protein